MSRRLGILDLLRERPVIGDGGITRTLEKRGYALAGTYTPEAVLEFPDAVQEIQKEFVRAGSDVIQTVTFYSSSGKLQVHDSTKQYDTETLNQAACDLAWGVAGDSGVLVCGGISPTPTYTQSRDKQRVQAEFQKQVDVLVTNNVDFLLGEFFGFCEEAVWAIELMKSTGLAVGCTLRCGQMGDDAGVSIGECAVRMAQAGADMVGVNCHFDPSVSLEIIASMKQALEAADLHPYLMMQPYGYHTQDVRDHALGGLSLPETPFAMDCRQLTRFDAHRYAREAYALGVRYLGGCCGLQKKEVLGRPEQIRMIHLGKVYKIVCLVQAMSNVQKTSGCHCVHDVPQALWPTNFHNQNIPTIF